ncbi:hypothetical protein DSECCO2_632000 [anaerobic digester metagenome]
MLLPPMLAEILTAPFSSGADTLTLSPARIFMMALITLLDPELPILTFFPDTYGTIYADGSFTTTCPEGVSTTPGAWSSEVTLN